MDESEKEYRSRTGRKISIQESDIKLKQQLRSAIRKIWSRYSRDREHALYLARREFDVTKKDGNLAKKKSVMYFCEKCQCVFKINEVQVDHTEPLGSTPTEIQQSVHWAVWLLKLFCSFDRLMVLCKKCHSEKTRKERKVVRKV